MAYLTNCKVCGYGIMNDELCSDCKNLIAKKVLAGKKVNFPEIKEIVTKNRQAKIAEAIEEHAIKISESIERDNWRERQKQIEQLKAEIERKNKALEDIHYLLQKMEVSPVLRRKIIQRNNWLAATEEIAEQALKDRED